MNGSLAAEVLTADGAVLLEPSATLTTDAVTVQIAWPGHPHPLAAVAGVQPFRLRFTLGPATQLYAFWTAVDGCGASNGFLGGGGPGAPDGEDTGGRC